MLHFGIITDIDIEKGRARVQFPDLDGMVSNWLPISVPKILNDKFSIPMDINEPVWCIMDENCENGIIGGAYPNKNSLPDAGSGDGKIRVKFNGSLSVEFDHSTSTLNIEGNGKININVTEVDIQADTVKITGDVEIIGSLSASGDVVGNGVDLKTHEHSGVQTGGGISGPPV